MSTPKERFDLLQVKNHQEVDLSKKMPRPIMNLMGVYATRTTPKDVFARIRALLTKDNQAAGAFFIKIYSWFSAYPEFFATQSWNALTAPEANSMPEDQYQNHLNQILDKMSLFLRRPNILVYVSDSEDMVRLIIDEEPLILEAIINRLTENAPLHHYNQILLNGFLRKKIVISGLLGQQEYSLLGYALKVNPDCADILRRAGARLAPRDLKNFTDKTPPDQARLFLEQHRGEQFQNLIWLNNWEKYNEHFLYDEIGYHLLVGIDKVVSLAGGYSRAIELLGIANDFDLQAKLILICAWSKANPTATNTKILYGFCKDKDLMSAASNSLLPVPKKYLDRVPASNEEEAGLFRRIKQNLPW